MNADDGGAWREVKIRQKGEEEGEGGREEGRRARMGPAFPARLPKLTFTCASEVAREPSVHRPNLTFTCAVEGPM